MNIFNKYETAGILLSIAFLSLALWSVRFDSGILSLTNSVDSKSQTAVVVVGESTNGESLREALTDASGLDGELLKLVIDDIRLGSGEEAKVGDTITVHYVGKTRDGIKFDSSYDRNEPFVFTIGEKKVIQGFEKGLVGMKVGGERILVIPSAMAYGNMQVGAIPPNSTLVFSIELLSIKQ